MTWLEKFISLSAKQEAPPEFKHFAGISLLGAVLRRNVWIRYFEEVFPNLFIILTGASGSAKKSTSTDICYEILCDDRFVHVNTIFGRATYEEILTGLVKPDLQAAAKNILKQDGSAYIICSEFTSLMEGQERILGLLGDLYKSPKTYEYKTKNHGKFRIENVCISLLAASTPKWLKRCIPDSETGEGFVGRSLWVAQQTDTDRVAWPAPDYRSYDAIERLKDELLEISEIEGEFVVETRAKNHFATWYESLGTPDDDRIQAINARKHVNVLKLAMIFAIDELRETRIKYEHMVRAVQTIEDLNPGLALALEHIGTPVASRDGKHILKIIRKQGGKIDHSDLARRVSYKIDAEHLGRVMDQLLDQDYISKDIIEYTGRSGRRPKVQYTIVREHDYGNYDDGIHDERES